jgi:hypothetical protein
MYHITVPSPTSGAVRDSAPPAPSGWAIPALIIGAGWVIVQSFAAASPHPLDSTKPAVLMSSILFWAGWVVSSGLVLGALASIVAPAGGRSILTLASAGGVIWQMVAIAAMVALMTSPEMQQLRDAVLARASALLGPAAAHSAAAAGTALGVGVAVSGRAVILLFCALLCRHLTTSQSGPVPAR